MVAPELARSEAVPAKCVAGRAGLADGRQLQRLMAG